MAVIPGVYLYSIMKDFNVLSRTNIDASALISLCPLFRAQALQAIVD